MSRAIVQSERHYRLEVKQNSPEMRVKHERCIYKTRETKHEAIVEWNTGKYLRKVFVQT